MNPLQTGMHRKADPMRWLTAGRTAARACRRDRAARRRMEAISDGPTPLARRTDAPPSGRPASAWRLITPDIDVSSAVKSP